MYNTYDFSGPADLVRRYAGLEEPLRGAGVTGGEPITVGGHLRVRPFNTADTYPEQRLGNDLAQAVVAGDTIYLRGQVAQDLDTRENVAVGDPAGQARAGHGQRRAAARASAARRSSTSSRATCT